MLEPACVWSVYSQSRTTPSSSGHTFVQGKKDVSELFNVVNYRLLNKTTKLINEQYWVNVLISSTTNPAKVWNPSQKLIAETTKTCHAYYCWISKPKTNRHDKAKITSITITTTIIILPNRKTQKVDNDNDNDNDNENGGERRREKPMFNYLGGRVIDTKTRKH